jgi:cobalamin biosynthesis Mg chelatase CobN
MVNSPETRPRDGSGTEVRTTEARQATTGTGLRYMLIGGLALIVIAFAIIYLTMMR